MSEDNKYGLLLNSDAKLNRRYFKEMVRLLGVLTIYRSPVKGGQYTLLGEFNSNNYSEPITVGCIFEEHADQLTAKKLGWNAELSSDAALIHVPYDLADLLIGCLFEIPSAFDNTPSRLFRVSKLSAVMIYPASITCEIVPEYKDNTPRSEVEYFKNSDFNLLVEG